MTLKQTSVDDRVTALCVIIRKSMEEDAEKERQMLRIVNTVLDIKGRR